MRSFLRRCFKISLVAIAFLVVAAVFIFFTIKTEWARTKILKHVEHLASNTLHGDLQIKSITGNLLSDISIHGIEVRDVNKKTVIDIDQINVQYTPLSLSRGIFEAQNISIVSPTIHLKKLDDGSLNILNLLVESDDKSNLNVNISHLTVHQGKIDFESSAPGSKPHVMMRSLNLSSAVQQSGDTVDLKLSSFDAESPFLDSSMSLKGNFAKEKNSLRVSDINAQISDSSLIVDSLLITPPKKNMAMTSHFTLKTTKSDIVKWKKNAAWPMDLTLAGTIIQRNNPMQPPWSIAATLASDAFSAQIESDINPLLSQSHTDITLNGFNPQNIAPTWPQGKVDITTSHDATWHESFSNLKVENKMLLNGKLMGVKINKMNWRATTTPKNAQFAVSMNGSGGRVSASGDVDYSSGIEIKNGKIAANLNLLPMGKFAKELTGLSGQLDLKAEVHGELAALKTQGKGSFTKFSHQELNAHHGRFQWDLDFAPGAQLGSLNLDADDIQKGDIHLEQLNLNIKPRRKGGLITLRARESKYGTVELDGLLLNKTDHWLFDVKSLRTTLTGSSWQGKRGHLKYFHNGQIVVKDLYLVSDHARLNFSMKQRSNDDLPVSLDLYAKNIDLKNSIPPFVKPASLADIEGIVDLSLKSRQNTPLSVELTASDIKWRNDISPISGFIKVETKNRKGHLRAELEHQHFSKLVSTIDFNMPKNFRSVSAWKKLSTKNIEKSTLTIDNLDLQFISPFMGTAKMEGIAHLKFNATKHLKDLTCGLSLSNFSAPSLLGAHTLNGAVDSTFQGPRGHLKASLQLNKKGLITLKIDGRSKNGKTWRDFDEIGPHNIESLDIKVDDLSLKEWFADNEYIGHPVAKGALYFDSKSNKLSAHATVSAPTEDSHPGYKGLFKTFGDSSSVTTTIEAGPLNRENSVNAKIKIRSGVGTLITDPSSFRHKNIEGHLEISRLKIATLAKLVQLDSLDGILQAKISMKGTIAKPILNGEASMNRFRYQKAPLPKVHIKLDKNEKTSRAHITLKQSKGNFQTILTQSGSNSISLKASAKNFETRFLNTLLLELKIPIAGLSGSINGQADGQLKDDLMINGRFELKNATIGLPRPIEPWHKMKAILTFKKSQALLSLQARSGKGRIKGEGTAIFDERKRPKVVGEITTTSLPIATKGLKAWLTSTSHLEAKRSGNHWKANVSISEGSVKLKSLPADTKLHSSEALSDVVYIGDDSLAKKPEAKTRIEVNITTPKKPLLIRGDKINVYTDLNIQADSTAEKLRLDGETTIVNGYVVLFDRKYMVDKAQVIFDADNLDHSRINLKITRDFPEARIEIIVEGTLEKPTITMQSRPPIYSQAQIMSLIINGTPGGQTGDESGNDAALSAIAGLVSSQLASAIKDPIGVDSLEFSTDDGGKISSVSVGKWLSEKLFLAYHRHFESDPNENQDEAILEWWLRSNWLMELRGGDAGAASGDLLWIWRY